MLTIFRYSLARFRGQIIGWGLGIFLLGLFLLPFYETIVEQQDQFQELLENYPPAMMAFFGDLSEMATPHGYLGAEYFALMPVILGIFAVLAGSGLLVSDEEKGTLDLILAHPISRTALFAGRVLAFVAATILMFFVGWLGLVLPTLWVNFDASWGEIALPFVSLLGVILVFGTMALLLSMVLPSRGLAAMLSGILVVLSYFITSLARIDDRLGALARLSPLNYYQSGDAMLGLNGSWLVGLLAVAALFTLAAWWLFQRRDIRVAGEGGWRLALPRRRAAAT
ncbi:MAG TPA: ABC transporter permease subunit [Ardenticatenaceae bacterium]|jgi:ABC-2 type transport system permease protein